MSASKRSLRLIFKDKNKLFKNGRLTHQIVGMTAVDKEVNVRLALVKDFAARPPEPI